MKKEQKSVAQFTGKETTVGGDGFIDSLFGAENSSIALDIKKFSNTSKRKS